jgi:hypothetical protein
MRFTLHEIRFVSSIQHPESNFSSLPAEPPVATQHGEWLWHGW